MTRPAFLLALGALAGFGSLATRGDAIGSDASLEEVQVTATRRQQAVFDVGTGVTVLSSEQLGRQAPRVLPDFLRGQEGVFVQQTTPGQAVPIVRGLKGSEVLHLVDGMRLNNAFFRNAPSQYLALVDAQNVQRLEVVRGPSSTLYGSDAMGGVVQVITPRPEFSGSEWQIQGTGRYSYDTADSSMLGRLALAGGRAGIGWSAGVTYQDVGDREGANGTLAPSSYTARAADAKLVLAAGEDAEFMLNLQYLEQPETPRYDELVPGFGETEPASEVFNFEPNDRLFVHGRYSLSGPLGFMDTLAVDFAFQEINDDRRTRNFGSTEERRERNRSRLNGLTIQATSEVGERHRLSYGVESYYDKVASTRVATDTVSGEIRPVTARFPDGSTMDNLAVYLNDEIMLSDALNVNAGARFSSFRIELPPADRGVGANVDVNDLTGNLGLVLEVAPDVHVVSNLGRGFRPPNIFDLGTLGERPGNRFNISNPDLEPESVTTLDAGIKFRTEGVRGELLVYRSDYQDKITSVPTGDMTDDGRTIVQSRNVNAVELYGAELGLRVEATAFIEAYGNLTWTHGEEKFQDGMTQPADRIPPLNGRVGMLYRPETDYWAEAYVRFADDQNRLSERDVGDARINPDGTPGWATLNLRFGWAIDERWDLMFSLDNLFDADYREHGSGIDAAGVSAAVSVAAQF